MMEGIKAYIMNNAMNATTRRIYSHKLLLKLKLVIGSKIPLMGQYYGSIGVKEG